VYIYHGEDIKRVDAVAEQKGMNPFTLMENAGRSLFLAIEKRITKQQKILVLAGTGNNGGDGIVLARYLKHNGYQCDLHFPVGMCETSTAIAHFRYYVACGYGEVELLGTYDVIVDALLGVGTRQPLPEKIVKVICWANNLKAYKIAIDLPTGVLANQGETDIVFKADLTLSLHGFKPSAFLEGSIEYYGEKEALDIGVEQDSHWRLWTGEDVVATFMKRHGGANKGTFGTGLLVAGNDEMPGSAALASLGAMRAGIGKLTVVTSKMTRGVIASRVPECTFMHKGLKQLAQGYIPDGINAAAIGPGLDDEKMIEQVVQTLLNSSLPLVLDAGALSKRTYPAREAATIVTPHPKEFSRMTGLSVEEIQYNRLDVASAFAKENGIIVVLKGRHTVVAFPDGDLFVNSSGNVGLAKGGTGDTLTGMLLAFLTSYHDVKHAVANAVYLHGACADYICETRAAASMLASDVSEALPYVMKRYE